MKMVSFLLIIITLTLSSCMNDTKTYQAHDGDILFQDLECGPLCSAIKYVTVGVDSSEFSHIGLVQNVDDKWMVLEAIGDGVKYTPIFDFFKRSEDEEGRPRIWVGRVKADYQEIIPKVMKEVETYLMKPYDDAFLMDNGKYYCSELIYEIFRKANSDQDFFDLEPMTFMDYKTDTFLPAWESYYQELGIPVPEGEPGINPAGISRSNRIEIVEKLGRVSLKEEAFELQSNY